MPYLCFLVLSPQQLCQIGLPEPILQMRSERLRELSTLTVNAPEHVRAE